MSNAPLIAAGSDWFADDWSDLWQVPLSALLMLAVVIVSVRVIGLRSFSKMSSFDFAVTVSIGSILGAVASSSADVIDGSVAVASLLGIQALLAWIRSRRAGVEATIDNSPILLMDGTTMLEDNLRLARVTRSDVVAKLREANVLRFQDIRAVVLETTGDISVLHGSNDIDPGLLEGLRSGPALDHSATEVPSGRPSGDRTD